MSNITIIFCLTGLCFATISPQNIQPVFTHLTIKDGLSQSTVEEILQDRKGFMWFGTNDGLNKYDGYNFTIYKYDPSDVNSISDNYVYGICEDDSGFLWIATNNGLNKYDPVTNKFTRFLNNPEDPHTLSFNLVHTVIKDRNNNIWAGTLGGGLNLFNRKSGTFVHLKPGDMQSESSDISMITSLCEDRNGNIWAGTYTGGIIKIKYDKRGKTEFDFFFSALITGSETGENIIWDIKEDKSGFIWAATNRTGVFKFNPEDESFVNFKPGTDKNTLNDFSVRKILANDDGSVFFGTKTGGLNILHPDGSFGYIKSDDNPGGLNDNSIWAIYKDRKGTLWVGTEFGGINKYDPYRSKFEHFYSYSDNLRKERVLFFYEEENGNIIIGTDGGLISFNKNKRRFKSIPAAAVLENEIVTSVLKYDKNIWVGTNSKGLFKIYPGGRIKKFESKSDDENSISNNNIKVMIKSRTGFLWLGTYGGGVDLFDPVNEKVVYHLLSKGIRENFIYSLLEDDNILWIGTYGDGLIRYNILTGGIKRFIHNPSDPNSLSNNRVYSLYSDSDGNLWAGTTGGLNLFNHNQENFTAFTVKDGLANDVIYSIIEDDEGFLWLSTNRGISRFNPNEKSFRNFTPKDGLQDYEFNRGAALKSKDGKLYFGGINGFNVFNPSLIKTNTFIPPVVITSFKKMNHEVSFPKSITEVDTIILAYDEDFFSFSFAALDFTDPENNRYAYMMEGFNEDWIYSGNENNATYTNLNPGEYIFKVKASNNDGIWNEEGVSVTVIVLPPFWQTWWFRSLAVIILIGILYSYYRIKLQRAIEIERLRTRIASDLHDDIGSNLTRIAMQSELILEDVKKDDYKNSLREIGEKSRELISTMSDVVWSIDARNDSVANLLDRMKEFSHSLLDRKNIAVSFSHKGITEAKKLPVDVRQNIYLIFKEAVNNIAKHSNASEVKILLKNSEDKFELRISDNGTNNTSNKKTGHGLKNMKMRAERIGGKLEISGGHGFEVLLKCRAI